MEENQGVRSTGALVGFAAGFTAELVRMHECVESGDIAEAWSIWNAIGPVARFAWEAPIREYRVRMKYLLELQGILPNAVVRAPAMPMSSAEKATMRDLVDRHGLRDGRYLPSGKAVQPVSA